MFDIRPMIRSDKPALMQILRITPEFKPVEVDVAEEVIDCYLDDPDRSGYNVLVAEAESGVSGYVCYGPVPLTEASWDMYWLAVAPPKQGQGIGAALVRAAEEDMKQAKGRLVVIETSSQPAYERIIRFHTGNGYNMVARIPDLYAPGDDKLVLLKRLEQAG
ncbi:MAG: GNAT family N-acetyltransferase [Chloroflexi bacterium]|nr:GNAT family N-acetyltransferase [Chloroflexota bacterium]